MTKKRKVKVVKRTQVDGNIYYFIQVQSGVFNKWVDAWDIEGNDILGQEMYTTIEGAIDGCKYFDGTEEEDQDIWHN